MGLNDKNESGMITMDRGWKFYKGEVNEELFHDGKALENAHDWTDVKIPHDWDIKGPFLEEHVSGESGGYAPCGIGWYKRTLPIPERALGKYISLRFDGIYKRVTLWLNGTEICKHEYGYGPFEVDISDAVKNDGENLLVVKVDNSIQPSCRWYSGSGIFRLAWLVIKEKVHVPSGGLFVSTRDISREKCTIVVETEITNAHQEQTNLALKTRIIDPGNTVVSSHEGVASLEGGKTKKITSEMVVPSPKLWNVTDPCLYTLEIRLEQDEVTVDTQRTCFGIRDVEFNGNGCFLNGEPILLKGVCLHHDGGCVGAAVPPGVWERRLKKLKAMGCNAIRTSHNVPASNFLDLCDRLGFLVIDEFVDKWFLPARKGSWDGDAFVEEWETALATFIKRDRNHPSVVLWSLGNEVSAIATPIGKEFHVDMKNLVNSLDPARPVTTVLSPGNVRNTLQNMETQEGPYLGDLCDVICINYSESRITEFHDKWPDKAIIIAEAHHYYRNKLESETHLPDSDLHPGCTPRNPWYDVVEHECCCGQFLWTGIEYLGEVRDPYPYHGRTNAPIRINGFHKPQASFHSSVWLDEPYVHLLILDEDADIPRGKPQFDFPKVVCHWNFEGREQEGEREAWIFTNCDKVVLRLNGRNLGEKSSKDFPYNTMRWSVPFEAGRLEAIGFDEQGSRVAEHVLLTSGPATNITLHADKVQLVADGHDCSNVEISLTDDQGTRVQLDDKDIEISISGPGVLLGIDSGDLSKFTEHGAYQQPRCKTYWGNTLAMVQSTLEKGEITVRVKGKGLKEALVVLNSK